VIKGGDMKKNIVIYTLLFLLAFSPAAFAEYVELVGKRVEIHGPYCYDRLGVALDKKTCDSLREALNPRSKVMFDTLLNSFSVLRITKNTKALVLSVEILEGRAKVVILTGIYKGMSGWIPIEWLKGNKKLPSIVDSDLYQAKKYQTAWLDKE
jgi:hypothetical protein